MKEVGKAVLTIPVFTSDVECDEVKAAMESVSAEDVKVWIDENIGKSLFVRRKQAFSLTRFSHEKRVSSHKKRSMVVINIILLCQRENSLLDYDSYFKSKIILSINLVLPK
jgi:hypothetical protein